MNRTTTHSRTRLSARPFGLVAALALALTIGLGTGACSRSASPPGAELWGIASATLAPEQQEAPVVVDALRLAPRNADRHNLEIEAALARSLGFRHVEVSPRAVLTLRYAWHAVPVDVSDEGPGLLLDGSIGQHGRGDLGVGLDLGLFSGGNTLWGSKTVRQTGFFLELAIEDAGKKVLWRSRAEGRSRLFTDADILKPLVPMLLAHLGQPLRAHRFSR